MVTLVKLGRFGTRQMYLGPDGRTGMRYAEAKRAHAVVAQMRAELDAELSLAKATGLGDHGKVDRLVYAIKEATGRMPWEVAA